MNALGLEQLERSLVAADAIVKEHADRLRVALERRTQIMTELEEVRPRTRNFIQLTPLVVALVRWSRWKNFNLPAFVAGPFTDVDQSSAWSAAFNDQAAHNPDDWHSEMWLPLLPPSPAPTVQGRGGEFLHAWRKTTRVIWECPCGEQESRLRAEDAPAPGGCSGLHNKATGHFEQIPTVAP